MGKAIGIINYAIQSKGPVPSGLMLESGGHLAGRLISEGYEPVVYDFNNVVSVRKIHENGKESFLKDTIAFLDSEIKKHGMKLLLFSLYTNGFKDNIKIATALRELNPQIKIGAGGPQVGWFEQEILNVTDVFDVLVRGEGDMAVVAMAEMVYGDKKISDIPGGIYKFEGEIIRNSKCFTDISHIPYPVYDKEVYPFFDEKIKVSTLRTSVGCRYGKCNFCVQPKIDGKYRQRDIDDVIKEIEFLKEKYGIVFYRLSDPNPAPEHLAKLFKHLPEGVRVSSFAYSDQGYNFENVKDQLIGLFIGVESLDPDTLRSLNKTDDVDKYISQCTEMVQEAKKHGIATIFANIVPIADDNMERIQKDQEKILELQPDFITTLPQSPLPFTPLYHQALRGDISGMKLSDNYFEDFIFFELDLLQPSLQFPKPPFSIRVDGKWYDNPFVVSNMFSSKLHEKGIQFASDEIVLMAFLYNGGLDMDQDKRREQVNSFNVLMRKCIVEGDVDQLHVIIKKINS